MRVLTKKAVSSRICYSGNHIDRMEAAGRFPRRVKLGPNRVGWLESEIDDWIADRVRERDADGKSGGAERAPVTA